MQILKVFVSSIMLFYERRKVLVKYLWLPMIIGLIATNVQLGFLNSDSYSVFHFLWTLVIFIVTIIIAVRCYKIFLLGKNYNEKRIISWTRNESNFLLCMLVISSVFLTLIFIVSILVSIFYSDASKVNSLYFLAIIVVPGVYLATRFLLVFPIVATQDIKISKALKAGWHLSQNNSISIFILCIFFPGVLAWIFSYLSEVLFIKFFVVLLNWFLMPLELAIVTMVLMTLRGSKDPM